MPVMVDTADGDQPGARCLAWNLTNTEPSLTSIAKVGCVHSSSLCLPHLVAGGRGREVKS